LIIHGDTGAGRAGCPPVGLRHVALRSHGGEGVAISVGSQMIL
jgi:hypothetical protein